MSNQAMLFRPSETLIKFLTMFLNFEDLSKDVESSEYIVQELEERNLIKPDIDYSDPSNFAFFGSAEKYYVDAIENICKKNSCRIFSFPP